MRHLLITMVILLAVLLAFTVAETYYVTSTVSTPCPEEGEPCLTLSQYANKPNNYFASNTTLILLPGNHSLDSEFRTRNTANLAIIRSTPTSYSDVDTSITCTSQSARFILNDIGLLSMRGLVLIGCINNNITSVEQFTLQDCNLQGQGCNGTGLELNKVTSANIVRSSFSSYTGEKILDPYWGFVSAGGAIMIKGSTVTISSSTFTNNTVSGVYKLTYGGGAVYAVSSNITIHTTAFTNNTATGYGGAVLTTSSNIAIHNTTFNYNTATGEDASGGAMHAESCNNITVHTTTFNNNSVTGRFVSGGAVVTVSCNMTLHTTTLNNNIMTGEYALSGAVHTVSSNITIHATTFNNNTVTGQSAAGGVMTAYSSNMTIHNTTINNNSATGEYSASGGAVYAWSSNIAIHTTSFNNNTVTGEYGASGGAVYARSSKITIHNTAFNSNTAAGDTHQGAMSDLDTGIIGGAVYAASSNIAILTTKFNNNTVTGDNVQGVSGGAVGAPSSNISIHTSTFNNNIATGEYSASGGAVHTEDSIIITIYNTTFNNNTAIGEYSASGGAVVARVNNITIHTTTFNNNTVTGKHYPSGGAVYASLSYYVSIHVTTFFNNSVTGDNYPSGGALYAQGFSNNVITMILIYNTTFNKNTVTGNNGQGGAMYLDTTTLNSTKFVTIKNNMADIGGTLYGLQSTMHFSGNTMMLNNYGSLYAYGCNVTFAGNINNMNNSYLTNTSQEGGAVTAIQSEIVFTGTVNFSYNTATHGGAISATQSKLYVYGDITIAHNTASISGGGIHAYQSELNLENHTNISNNSAVERGGGIHAISSIARMTDYSKTYLVGNHAKRGGGACLEINAKLYIIKKRPEHITEANHGHETWIRLEFTENSADYGGALYITDDTNSGTCHATPFSIKSTFLSECFIQGLTLTQINQHSKFSHVHIRNTYFTNNSATKGGDAIYGGLLDRCTISPYAEIFYEEDYAFRLYTPSSLSAVDYFLNLTNLNTQDFNDSVKTVSSDPVRVCFCRDNQPDCNYHPQPVKVRKGEMFIVPIAAVDQVNNTISNSTILSQLSTEAGLGEGQSNQTTGEGCTELHYTVTSPRTSEQLHLYANGSCKDTGISLQTVDIYFKACPIGFKDTGSKCDCDPKLNQYISNCSIASESVLRRGNVWIAFMNRSANKSVVTYPNCPFDYCYPSTNQIRIKVAIPDDADKQCAFNRSGKLCGSCENGLSVSLGSSRCMPCSNKWLALLFVFAIAGIALVAFILVCNLTVAAGTVNGLIFYANIVSSNKAIFSNSSNRFFTIFIAWLNLDFGFETCFFNGLNGYSNTWLQLAFPFYVIFLVILIIKACEYSTKFTRFMRLITRNNPVATLDTLVLLSYTKFIRTIISAWQFATLQYSDGTRETVWLVDGNIKYFELKHILLFAAAFVIFMVALVYTLFLFFWQWLLLCPNRKPVRWIRNSKLHGIMDAYFIAFNKSHRYWTGLLLLARVLLYLVSAVNGSQNTDPRMNLLAISCVTVSLILWKELTRGRVYRKWPLNALDTLFLFNLSIFSAVTLYVMDVGGNQTAVASISVSITFITFILIISYHAYAFILQTLVEKIKAKLFRSTNGNESQQVLSVESAASNHNSEVTVSVVDVPLIPLDTEENEILNGFDRDEEDDSVSNNDCPTTAGAEETQSQIELEVFGSDNPSSIDNKGPLSIPYCQQEVKAEESDASDYDEQAPLLQLYNTA